MFTKFIAGFAESLGIQQLQSQDEQSLQNSEQQIIECDGIVLTTQTQQTVDQIQAKDLIDNEQLSNQKVKNMHKISTSIEEQKQSNQLSKQYQQLASISQYNSERARYDSNNAKARHSMQGVRQTNKQANILKLNPSTMSKCQSVLKMTTATDQLYNANRLLVSDQKLLNVRNDSKNLLFESCRLNNFGIPQQLQPRHHRLGSNTQYEEKPPSNLGLSSEERRALENRCISPRQSTAKINPLVTQSCKRLPNTVYVPSRKLDQIDDISIQSGEDDIPLESQEIVSRRDARFKESIASDLTAKRPININRDDFFKQLIKTRDSLIAKNCELEKTPINIQKNAEVDNFTSYAIQAKQRKQELQTEKNSFKSPLETGNQLENKVIVGTSNKLVKQSMITGDSKQLTASTTPIKVSSSDIKMQTNNLKQRISNTTSHRQQSNPFRTIQETNSDIQFENQHICTTQIRSNVKGTSYNINIDTSDLNNEITPGGRSQMLRSVSREIIYEASSDGNGGGKCASSSSFYPSNQSNFNYQPKFFKPSQQSSSSVQRQMSNSIQTHTINNITNSTLQNEPKLKTNSSQSCLTLLYKKMNNQPSSNQLQGESEKFIIQEFQLEREVIHEQPQKQKSYKQTFQNKPQTNQKISALTQQNSEKLSRQQKTFSQSNLHFIPPQQRYSAIQATSQNSIRPSTTQSSPVDHKSLQYHSNNLNSNQQSQQQQQCSIQQQMQQRQTSPLTPTMPYIKLINNSQSQLNLQQLCHQAQISINSNQAINQSPQKLNQHINDKQLNKQSQQKLQSTKPKK